MRICTFYFFEFDISLFDTFFWTDVIFRRADFLVLSCVMLHDVLKSCNILSLLVWPADYALVYTLNLLNVSALIIFFSVFLPGFGIR